MYTVSITSQGQMSIPMPLRKLLGLNEKTKALVSAEGNRLIVEPVPDLLDLAGAFNKYAKKGMTASQIMKMEKKAVEDAVVERFLAKEKRPR